MGAIAQIFTANSFSTVIRSNSSSEGVGRTFDPEGFRQAGIARWVDRSGGIQLGYPSISLGVRPPTKASRIHKVSLRVALPTLEVTSPSTATGIQPQPTLAYSLQCMQDWMLPERCTVAERNLLFATMVSLMATTINAFDDAPTNLSGSPLPDAIINLGQPY